MIALNSLLVAPALSAADVTLREIRIFGNKNTADSIILHNCELKAGKRYTQKEIERRMELTRQNLVNTYYFDMVNVFDLPRTVPNEAVVMIDLREGSPWHASASTWSAKLYRDNIGGRGLTVGAVAGDVSSEVFFEQSWFLDTCLRINGRSFLESGRKTTIENERGYPGEWFYTEVFGAENGLAYAFTGRTVAGIRATWERHDFYDVVAKADPQGRFGVGDNHDLVFIKPFIEIDRRDSDRYPTEGFYVYPILQYAHDILGSYKFFKGYIDGRLYINPFDRTVLATRLRGGWCSDETPYFELFNIGGIDGIRAGGYNNIVGNTEAIADIELRQYLFRSPIFDAWFEGVIFADVGWTWDRGEKVDFGQPAYAFGPGLRLHFRKPIYMDGRLEYGIGEEDVVYLTVSPVF
ncbi:MAG: BamA/TamA family outer membrane protein [bacterium]|nr:BamA/TamA family outer membrane protein [bacterium]